jgi:hypothetical protein
MAGKAKLNGGLFQIYSGPQTAVGRAADRPHFNKIA